MDQLNASTIGDRQPVLSVVIPHYNDLDNLDRCLDLLGRQDFAETFEIIVVDNASAVPFDQIEARVNGRARVILCTERGAGPTRNAGIRAARADRLAFIDSDCRPRPEWLGAGNAALEHHDFVGGSIDVDVEDPENLTPVEAFERVFAFRTRHYVIDKKFSVTANLFVHRRVFDAVGQFKSEVSEDVEWCHRANAGGFRLGYAPEARMSHPARRNWAELHRKWQRLMDEGFALARTERGGVARWLVRSWAVLLSIAPHLVQIAISPKLGRWRDRVAAATVLVRLRVFRFLRAHQAVLRMLSAPRGGI